MAEKRWPQEEKSAHNGQEARPRSLKGRESNERNPETGAAGKKNEKTSDALDTGGRMRLQWATFQAWSVFRYIQMGNPGLGKNC